MANRLTNLDVAEVSLVRKPANKRAFLIYKQLEGGESLMAELNDKILETLARDFPAELEEKITMQNELDEEAREVVKNVVQLLRAYKQELPEDILETVAELAELKLPEPVVDQDEPPKEEEEKVEIMAGFPRPVKKSDGSYDLSNVPKEQRTIIEALWKQAERSEMLAKELREEKQRRIKKEFEERAREFENLPISAEELGQILQVFHAKAKDEFEKIEGLLRAVNEALGQSELFKEMGSSFNGPAGGAWSKVEKMAESLIQKDVSLTKEKAVALVLERNPDLYKQYLAEQQK